MLKQALKLFFQKNNFIFIILILFGVIVRFLWLDRIPVGITHDDADVVLSAKSLWVSGRDISGTSFPSTLFFNKTPGKISALPSVLLSPILGPLPLNLFSIHFVYTLINLLTIIFIAGISYNFFKDIKFSLAIVLAGLFNPWFFVYSRYPTEAPFALLFTVIGIYLLFKEKARGVFLSTLFFILSFYSYFGAKVAIPLVFPLLLLIRYFSKGYDLLNLKSYILSFLFFVLVVGGYFFVVLRSPESTFSQRAVGEFIFSDMSQYQSQVNETRRASIDFPFKNLFFNKYILVSKEITQKYFGWLSPDYLFLSGDSVSVYRFGEHGLFYFIDILLVAIGISYFVIQRVKKPRIYIYILITLILIAPLGSSISRVGNSYFFRSFLLIPVAITLIAGGLYFISIKLSPMFTNLVLVAYLIFFLNFLVFYFFRYPVKQQDNQFLEGRVLSSYIQRSVSKGVRAIVHTQDQLSTYHLYLFYGGFKNQQLLPFTSQFFDIKTTDTYMTNNCDSKDNGVVKIFETKLNCPKIEDDYVIIQNQKDAGAQYLIYNDKVCGGMILETYRRVHNVSDYAIETMTDKEFCNRWIFKE